MVEVCCRYCTGAAYIRSDDRCLQRASNRYKQYINCNKRHVIWNKKCPVMKKQYDCTNITYQSQPLQFAVAESGISCRYNKEIPEPIRITGKRPVLVPISPMKRYATGLFQTEPRRIGRPKKDILPIKKVKLGSMDAYITISTI